MEDREFLMMPGPVSVDDEVLEALGRPVRAHYGDAWTELHRRVVANLQTIFATQGEVYLIFGSGMAGVEACLGSTLSPGDEVLIPSNGLFGDRLLEVARSHRFVVRSFATGPREAITAEAVEQALDANPGVRALALVHHETSIGVVNEVRESCRLARDRGLLTVVDGISSVGGLELEMDAWGVDLCVTVANKNLGAPIGVAPVAVGPRALEAIEDGRPKSAGWYLNLATWRHYTQLWGSWHPHPTTMPTNVVEALDVALSRLLAEGIENHRNRLVEAQKQVRRGLREMGFEMLVSDRIASPATTAVLALPGMDVRDYMSWLLENRGIRIGGGLGPLAGKIFRVGHMGRAGDPAAIETYLRSTADYLETSRLAAVDGIGRRRA